MNTFDLDKQFNRRAKMIYAIWAISAILSVSVFGMLAWVAWHFLSKIW